MTEDLQTAPRRGRPPIDRAELRAPLRGDDARSEALARAEQRAAELRGNIDDFEEGQDDFYIPEGDVPDGWSYEWKRHTTLNKEDPAYQVQLARTGWEPVPASRHPTYMPSNTSERFIERKGMILMERPAVITREMADRDYRKARDQVRRKEEQLGAAPAGHFERDNKGNPLAKVKKSVEHIPIPTD